ncbi:hypothetical protein [Pseudidiomarina sediminum]|uniref:hypothetical protein n=1 Tax=Pseudidiomarina sediminum TaxID=431675 RepID=UPI001C97A0CF|nr:hypothetical protein [Pseudidiomarina sediminum]MBY6062831.1 hypothetical protein [Pseudidiomarina sediminum]
MNNPLAGTDPSGYLWCAAETIWINGGPAVTNGARHSPRSAATGEQEREAIGGPGEGGTNQSPNISLENETSEQISTFEGRAELYKQMQGKLDEAGIDTVWFGVAGDLNDFLLSKKQC